MDEKTTHGHKLDTNPRLRITPAMLFLPIELPRNRFPVHFLEYLCMYIQN